MRNLPEQCSDRQLTQLFKQSLKHFEDPAFLVHKLKNKTCAELTISNVPAATKFLHLHGQRENALQFMSRSIICQASNTQPDPFVVQSLQQQDEERHRKRQGKSNGEVTHEIKSTAPHTFAIESVSCGQWEYYRDRLNFLECYSDHRAGPIVFGGKNLVIFLNRTDAQQSNVRIDIEYSNLDAVVTGTLTNRSTVTFSLRSAPKFTTFNSDTVESDGMSDLLGQMMQRLSIKPVIHVQRARALGLSSQHEADGQACFVYQVVIKDVQDLNRVQSTLRGHGAPPSIWQPTARIRYDWAQDFSALVNELAENYPVTPFAILFQTQRLAQDGILSPRLVRQLIPPLKVLSQDTSLTTIALAEGIRSFSRWVPYPGPATEAKLFAIDNMVEIIKKRAAAFRYQDSDYARADIHEQFTMIFRAAVTPASIYLEGPDIDTTNRVLRKYRTQRESFIRVTFADEDGTPEWLDRNTSGDEIYGRRFAGILNGSFPIAGRVYQVLGWSHSSLRTHQTWFVAPFVQDGGLIVGRRIIADLGDFSSIRSPAKCAARIGQTFSDSTETIRVDPENVLMIDDIERNDRVFTDGVGTISLGLLRRIWKEFRKTKKSRATIVQIRYQGKLTSSSKQDRYGSEVKRK